MSVMDGPFGPLIERQSCHRAMIEILIRTLHHHDPEWTKTFAAMTAQLAESADKHAEGMTLRIDDARFFRDLAASLIDGSPPPPSFEVIEGGKASADD